MKCSYSPTAMTKSKTMAREEINYSNNFTIVFNLNSTSAIKRGRSLPAHTDTCISHIQIIFPLETSQPFDFPSRACKNEINNRLCTYAYPSTHKKTSYRLPVRMGFCIASFIRCYTFSFNPSFCPTHQIIFQDKTKK